MELILATRGGILLFDKKTGKVINDYPVGSNHIYRCEALWLGTVGNGLGIFNIRDESFNFYRHEPAMPSSCSGGGSGRE